VANEIVMSSQLRARSIFENLEAVSVFVSSYAMAVNATWPFVVVADFQVHGMVSNQITGASTLTLTPFVRDEERADFELFAVENQGWLAEGHFYDSAVSKDLYKEIRYNDTTEGNHVEEQLQTWDVAGIYPSIWISGSRTKRPVPAPQSTVYAPMWQRAPAEDFSPRVLFDTNSMPEIVPFIEGMLKKRHPVLTSVSDANYLKLNYDNRFPDEDQRVPQSFLLQPVYDSLLETRGAPVAFLSAFLRWDKFFVNVLPETERGVYVVLDGTCGQTFTFMLHGGTPEYLGEGDLHDESYDAMARTFEFAPFARLEENAAEAADNNFCQYSARIYISDTWSERFFTEDPQVFAAAVAGCFVVTTLVFVLYDLLVQVRCPAS
jgi:hypothetical protein